MTRYGDLTAASFCRGILMGLVAIDKDTVKLISPEGHFAAAKAFEYLSTNEPVFDLRFRIFLDPLYEESYTWKEAILYMKHWRIITDEDRDREFLIQPRKDDLDQIWLPSQPGPRDLWERCARVYCVHFVQYLRTHPEPRSA